MPSPGLHNRTPAATWGVDFRQAGKYNVFWTEIRSVILKKGARQIWKTAAEAADVIPAISVNLRNLYGSGLLFIGNTGLVLPLTVLKTNRCAGSTDISGSAVY